MTFRETIMQFPGHVKHLRARMVSTYVSVSWDQNKDRVSISDMEERNNLCAERC